MARYPLALAQLIAFLKRLPGVGSKTAERYAFHLLSWPEAATAQLADLIRSLQEKVCRCTICGCLTENTPCQFCDTNKRDTNILCIISSPKDAYAIEDTQYFRGLYHVLGGLLSPLDGRMPTSLPLSKLMERIQSHRVQEVIIALDSTIEGDATALYLKEQLAALSINVSRLALGLPLGSPLEYIDSGTLSRALSGRQQF